jgi:hypothetical protein
MDLTAQILGSNTARTLAERAAAPLLQIGRDSFTRRDFANVDCFSFVAAQNLSYWLNKVLKVTDTRDVYENVTPAELAIPHIGAFSLAVLGAAFEVKGLGGNNPLAAWLKRHEIKAVTFHTLKQRELAERADESKARRQRTGVRRNSAHRLRLDRFHNRRKGAA